MNTIDGDRLRNMIIFGVYELNEERELLNSLNVFPVPDGDTGTNMSMTSTASLKELDKLDSGAGCAQVAEAVASGSLRGARGNSGVILSQLFRGFAKGLKGKKTITTADFAEALTQSAETAYKAVMKPKEGTVLTVARETAKTAHELAGKTKDFDEFLSRVIERASVVLIETTNMLPALKAAGVVDAGAKGLVSIYRGFYKGLTEKAPTDLDAPQKERAASTVAAAADADIKFCYCTEFLIESNGDGEKLASDFSRFLETKGDSIVTVGDESIIKIHVHTNNPGEIIERALKIGQLTNIKIENMRIQHTEFAAEKPVAPAELILSSEGDKTNANIGIVVISVGEGLNSIFAELGCDTIIEGGQTMNPSADDIFKAAEKVNKDNIIILPNNKNIVLAAKQAAELLETEKGKVVRVLETKSIPQGIGALIAMLHDRPLEETLDAMEAGAKYVRTGQVTAAVRDTVADGKVIKTGDYIGIIDGEIVTVEKTALDAGKTLIDIFAEECEIITIFYSTRDMEAEGRILKQHVIENALECELHYGGQPVYDYVISAE